MTALDSTADYAELTTRNRGFIPAATQERLSRVVVLVAGCGSTGGAAVEPLVRLGVQHFLLADNGTYELNNLNRQNAFVHELGLNKAAVCADRVTSVNPAAITEVHTDGITESNVDDLVRRCDVVVDGVDVTEPAGWLAKYALHASAARHRRPVLSGYDMAGTQYVRLYDYRQQQRPFDGRISAEDVIGGRTWALLRRVVPMRVVPVEMLDNARASVASGADTVPQLVYTSLLFGAIASRMVVEILGDAPVRRHTLISVDRAIRPTSRNLRSAARKPVVALLALRDLARTERKGVT